MDKASNLAYTLLELSKLSFHATYYDELQPHFGPKDIELQNMLENCFMLSVNTEGNTNDIKILKDQFCFGDINREHPLIPNQ